jgi:hypothetical protein
MRLWFSAYRSKTDMWDNYHEFEDWQLIGFWKTGWKIIDRQKWTNPVNKLESPPITSFNQVLYRLCRKNKIMDYYIVIPAHNEEELSFHWRCNLWHKPFAKKKVVVNDNHHKTVTLFWHSPRKSVYHISEQNLKRYTLARKQSNRPFTKVLKPWW